MSTVRKGARGAHVTEIQKALSKHGFWNFGKYTDFFGDYTENQLKAFQRAKGLGADGIVGAKTRAKLFAQKSAPAPEPQTGITPDERLSANFTLMDYLRSATATREKIHEQFNPPAKIIKNIRWVNGYMQKARDLFGKALSIGSGYRCKRLNTLVGGATRSEHLDALGVDIPTRNFTQAETIKLIEIFIGLGVKRIGIAKTFIHVGFSSDRPQNVVFDYQGAKATPLYLQRERARFVQLMRSTKAKLV